eukprot:385926_1
MSSTSLLHIHNQIHFKICIVGERNAGSSTLCQRFRIFGPQLIDNSTVKFQVLDDKSYLGTDIFIICMDISDIISFNDNKIQDLCNELWSNVKKREPGRSHTRSFTYILVGNKSDLRQNPNIPVISKQDCIKLCKDIHAVMYIELSTIYATINEFQQIITNVLKCEMFNTQLIQMRHTWNGYKLPLKIDYKLIENIESDNNDRYENQLLIAAYLRAIKPSKYCPFDILNVICLFYYSSDMKAFYYHNHLAQRRQEHFGVNKQLKHGFYTMYLSDMIAVIIHNISWFCFALQLLLMEDSTNIGIVAMVFSIMECVIIVTGYLLMWYHPNIEYYTQAMILLHISMELCINLPMIIILFVYVFRTDKELIVSFYVSLCVYILYACYKCGVSDLYFGNKNMLYWESQYKNCVKFHFWICVLSMVCLLVIGFVYAVEIVKIQLAIVLIVSSLLIIVCLGVYKFLHGFNTSLSRYATS